MSRPAGDFGANGDTYLMIIDANKISARIEQGLATLTLPKAEHFKPRKITVFLSLL